MAEAARSVTSTKQYLYLMAIKTDNNGDVDTQIIPRCIASTGESFCGTVANTNLDLDFAPTHGRIPPGAESNCFRSADLSADGSTVLTLNEDQRLRSFVLPPDLLDEHDSLQCLEPQSIARPTKTLTSALYPGFSLANTGTTIALQACNDLPIRLVNILDFSYTHATYPWVNASTEAWIAPHSLLFSSDGLHFVAGTKEKLAVFDVSRDGEGPVTGTSTRKSQKSRRAWGEHETPLSGIVTALSLSRNNEVLAAGTTGREIGLYAAGGMGEKVTSFSIRDDLEAGANGAGVTQLSWSSCGNYLFVAERKSDAILIYDIRQGQRLSWLRGRKADTSQRLSFDLLQTSDSGHDIWAGGTDGKVRIWRDVTRSEDVVDPDAVFPAGIGRSTSSPVKINGADTIRYDVKCACSSKSCRSNYDVRAALPTGMLCTWES